MKLAKRVSSTGDAARLEKENLLQRTRLNEIEKILIQLETSPNEMTERPNQRKAGVPAQTK